MQHLPHKGGEGDPVWSSQKAAARLGLRSSRRAVCVASSPKVAEASVHRTLLLLSRSRRHAQSTCAESAIFSSRRVDDEKLFQSRAESIHGSVSTQRKSFAEETSRIENRPAAAQSRPQSKSIDKQLTAPRRGQGGIRGSAGEAFGGGTWTAW